MYKTCYEMLQSCVDRDGFIVYFNHKIPMKKFLRDIDGLAAAFSNLQLKTGDVITLYLPTCPQSLAAFYACSKLGLVANIVHPQIPLNLLISNLKKTRSKLLFFYDVLVHDERPFLKAEQILVRCSVADYVSLRKPAFAFYGKLCGKRIKNVYTYAKICAQNEKTGILGKSEDTLCYMHSGGTSGEPKIVRLSNKAFIGTAFSMKEMYKPTVNKGDYNLVTLPVFHAYGLGAGIHTPLCLGCSLILVPKFRPEIVKKYFCRYRITIWSVVPAMLKKSEASHCLDGKWLKNLDVIWCGGDVLDETTVENTDKILAKYCPRARLMRGYGLTEVCGVCAVNSYLYYKKGSCGKPLPNCYALIADSEGKILSPNQIGEIYISSTGNMQGYLDDNEAEKKSAGELKEADCTENISVGLATMVRYRSKIWISTGDVGYVDDDGYLFVVDRKKRTIKIAAVNVFPSQVENCVKKLSFVDEACAVGVKVEGKQFIKVYVTLKAGSFPADPNANVVADETSETVAETKKTLHISSKVMQSKSDFMVIEQQVKQICRENLIKYAVPGFVEVLSAMPRTSMGKIDYRALQDKENNS